MIGACVAAVEDADIPELGGLGKNCGPILTPSLKAAATAGTIAQAIFEMGGVDLDNAVKTVDLKELLLSITPIVEFLSTLNGRSTRKFFHQDIKPGNMVFKDGLSRLIDFGLSSSVPDALSTAIYAEPYRYWPPEADVMHALINGRERKLTNYTKAMRAILDQFNRMPVLVSGIVNYTLDYDNLKRELLNVVQSEIAPGPPYTREQLEPYFFSHFGDKLDIYSLGVTVAEVVNESSTVKSLSREEMRNVGAWVRKATSFNVFTRFTPQEAYAEWLKIWSPSDMATIARLMAAQIPALPPPAAPMTRRTTRQTATTAEAATGIAMPKPDKQIRGIVAPVKGRPAMITPPTTMAPFASPIRSSVPVTRQSEKKNPVPMGSFEPPAGGAGRAGGARRESKDTRRSSRSRSKSQKRRHSRSKKSASRRRNGSRHHK